MKTLVIAVDEVLGDFEQIVYNIVVRHDANLTIGECCTLSEGMAGMPDCCATCTRMSRVR